MLEIEDNIFKGDCESLWETLEKMYVGRFGLVSYLCRQC